METLSQDATAALAAFQTGIKTDHQVPTKDAKGNDVVPTMPLEPTAAPSAVDSKSATVETFYSRGESSRYVFTDGGVATFMGGQYKFDPATVPEDYSPPFINGKQDTPEEGWARRYKELKYVCGVPNPVFSLVPVPVHKSDAHVLREVGHAGGGTASTVGMLGSFQVAGNLKPSVG